MNLGPILGAKGKEQKAGASGLEQELGADLGKLIELFEQRSPELRFPGVTATSLGEARERMASCERSVESKKEELLKAEAELGAELSELRSLAQKAVAYARVFAEGDAELRAKLEGITLGSKSKTKRKRKTMQRRGEPESRTLPFAGPGAAGDPDGEQQQAASGDQAVLARKSA